MKCTNCGNDIANECTFCPECGTGINNATQADAAQEAKTETVETQSPVVTPVAAPAKSEITEDTLPAKFKPMGAWSYFGHSILFSIPLVGLIFLIVFATGGTRNINKRNYARSYFCGLAIFAVIAIVVVVLLLVFGAATGVGTSLDSIANSVY
ncbi:MAG: zinc ribbon domain-containing protein [Ruminococcus sp.]|nr:zinc ribbon domain-containing protein [Ruminococcus sp.]